MAAHNRILLITGASRGIGKALAEKMLAAGGTVIVWGLHEPDLAHENLHFIACDVSREEEVDRAWSRTLLHTGRIDWLVNNAGLGHFSPVELLEPEKWRRMMDVNVTGTFLATRKVVPLMKEQGHGHIVNISSIAGKMGAPQGEGYNASKWAVTGFTECLFQELRPFGIKVTTVFPGSTQTNFFDEIPGMEVHGNMLHPDDLADTLMHVLDSPPNYLIREIEVRPLKSKKN